MKRLLRRLGLLGLLPVSHEALILIGYTKHVCGYYCIPAPYNGAYYRIEYKATVFKGMEPMPGTEEWRAYLTNEDSSTIRRFKTLSELNYFHRGMCGTWLF